MSSGNLIIGWQVNRDLDPLAARIGLNAPRVVVPVDRIDKHTAVIAQSGSGKSFFLGRYLEEILLRTRSKCVVLDPNGDFSAISKVEKSISWGKNEYDYENKRGRITHETKKKDFVDAWNAVQKRVRMAPQFASRTSAEPLAIHWADVSAGLVAPDFDPAHVHEVKDCHRILQALCRLWTTVNPKDNRDIFQLSRGMILAHDVTSASDWLESQFPKDGVVMARTNELLSERGITKLTSTVRNYYEGIGKSDVVRLFETIMRLHAHIPDTSKRYYLSKATSLCHDPIFSRTAAKPKTIDDYRADIVDLSSIGDENTRLLTINAVLRRQCDSPRLSDSGGSRNNGSRRRSETWTIKRIESERRIARILSETRYGW